VALSADGSTLAVGAYQEDGNGTDPANNAAVDAGAVYVFSRTGIAWGVPVYLKASIPDADDRFGVCVALSADGDMLAVGANREGSSATGIGGNQVDYNAAESGAGYLLQRNA